MNQTHPKNLLARMGLGKVEWQNRWRINNLTRQVATHGKLRPGWKPVVIVNLSSRLTGLSQNAAFSLLAAWGLRLAGAPVVHFVCRAGMSHCVLGINRQDYTTPPPCAACIANSRRLFNRSNVHWFEYKEDASLAKTLRGLNIEALCGFTVPFESATMPLGRLVLPSIRWALRCHNLPDDEPTRYLLRQYLLSAFCVAQEFARLLDHLQPETALIFNGIMYPEAAARWVSQQRGLRLVTHEVGFQPFSAFFTEGEATAYPIHIPEDFELTSAQNARLDAYLEQRFKGMFTMAGIRFWPEMAGLDEAFLQRTASFKQIVPVFTNVVYDTSQVHANRIFQNMFEWLEVLQKIIRAHAETFFVIRAHPDEMRPGTAKQSRESVRDWVHRNHMESLPNVAFIDSQEYISSYELIRRSKFLVVYNSSIGLEAILMGVPVLCGGKARYTQYPTVFLPETQSEFMQKTEQLLSAERIELPSEYQRNARRFLYFQLYRVSLPFERFMQSSPRPGFVHFRPFSWVQLEASSSPGMQAIVEGILNKQPFVLEEENGYSPG